jgi:chitinase
MPVRQNQTEDIDHTMSTTATSNTNTQAAAWLATDIYTAGMTVVENGIVYRANWWTEGNNPADNNGGVGTGEPWTIVSSGSPTGPSVPNAPTGLTAASESSTSVSLTWTAATVPGGGTITGYIVYENGQQIGTTATTSYTAAGLTAATAYLFTVVATDSAGSSAPTAALSLTTPAGSQPPASTIAAWTATSIYTTGMQVSEGGLIYQANWWTQGNDPSASNGAIGTGEPWTVIGKVNTTPTAPNAPTNLSATALSSATAFLSWTAAAVAGSGTISGYTIFENGTQIGTTTNTWYDATSLVGSDTYKFTVLASDATGNSPVSAAASVTMPAPGTTVTPTAVYAPYIDMSLYGSASLAAISEASGIKTFTLAFVQSSGAGTVGWAGIGTLSSDTLTNSGSILSQVQALEAIGGNVIISFGGSAGTDPALAATSAAALQAEYQSVINRYGVTSLDFDVEGMAIANQTSIDLRNQALVGLEAANPGLDVSFTVPVLPTGLDYNGMNFIQSAVKDGVHVNVVNIMAMDYGSSVDQGGAMGTDTIDAIKATEGQLASAGLSAKLGVTMMIGVNDVSSEVFTLADAQQVSAYVQTDSDVARTAIWSVGRDNGSMPGGQYASPTASGVAQTAYQFSGIFEHA